MKEKYSLEKLKIGNSAKVVKLDNIGSIRRRLLDIGLIPGTIITAEFISPFNDPIAYKIRNALIAIRKIDAKNIIVEDV